MRTLMLVSADASEAMRLAVSGGARPKPEFLVLEEDYGVRLLDWSMLGLSPGRSMSRSVRHVTAAMHLVGGSDLVFSDGEHVGIPMGVALEAIGPTRPHLVLGHHLTSRSKPRMLRWLRHMGITRVLVHSRTQLRAAVETLGFSPGNVAFVPYYADAHFWRPVRAPEERLVVAAGSEHRDYATLATAVSELEVRTVIAAGSLYSPNATRRVPAVLPAHVSVGMRNAVELRSLYARAAVVVVPLLPNDFQAGVTTLLEAMAMARPVIVSATEGQRDIVIDGETGVLVPPRDQSALRSTLRRLLDDPAERRRLGTNARDAVLAQFDVPIYAAALHRHMVDILRPARRAA